MLERRLIDGLYTEAMLLADEARGYFDLAQAELQKLSTLDRVVFSCESLKVTTRLMHVIAWLLTQRAVASGEIALQDAYSPSRRLGMLAPSEDDAIERLPAQARLLVTSSIDLFRRVERIEHGVADPLAAPSPALSLLHRLERSF